MQKYTHEDFEGTILAENIRILNFGVLPNALTLKEQGYVLVEEEEDPLSLEEKKIEKKVHLKGLFNAKATRPRVDTTLGFFVDGSAKDLTNLENGQKLGVPFVKDADGEKHDIELSDWDTILQKIREHGLTLFNEKWQWEAEIDACQTAEELDAIDVAGAFGTAVAE